MSSSPYDADDDNNNTASSPPPTTAKQDIITPSTHNKNNQASVIRHHFEPTLGIDNVFLEPPSHSLPSEYLSGSPIDGPNSLSSFTSTELVGRLKTIPEDFIVRELLNWRGMTVSKGDDADEDAVPTTTTTTAVATYEDGPLQPPAVMYPETAASKAGDDDRATASSQVTIKEPANKQVVAVEDKETTMIDWNEAEDHPHMVLDTILSEHATTLHLLESPEQLVRDLSALQTDILQSLDVSNDKNNKETDSPATIASLPDNAVRLTLQGHPVGREQRGLMHRWVRSCFPILNTDKATPSTANNGDANANHHVITARADDRFVGLVPYLHNPPTDILRLHRFFRRGNQQSDDTTTSCHQDRHGGSSHRSKVVLPLRVDVERSQRRPIHQLLAEKSARHFQTETVSEYSIEGSGIQTSAVVVTWSQKIRRKRKRSDHHGARHRSNPTYYILLVLRKRNVEHTNALYNLSKALRCRSTDIQYAGIKDRQAITTQFITLNNQYVSIQRILAAQTGLRSQDLDLGGPLRWVKEGLRRGQAQGNRFIIVLRDLRQVRVIPDDNARNVREEMITAREETLREAVDRLRRCGFINFFGEQRIGDITVEDDTRTVDVGRALLRREWTQILDKIMRTGTDGNSIRVSQVWQSSQGNVAESWKALAKSQGGESRQRKILQCLKRHGEDKPMLAVESFSHSERAFWISAYQSFVWNTAASARIRQYGANGVVVGDLVQAVSNSADDGPRIVTTPEMARGYTIENVVLPLPGYNVEYPSNDIGQVYRDMLEKDDITLVKDAPLDATAKGNYRFLIARAENTRYEWLTENDAPACRFQFDLPSGSYATMLLRELLRTTMAR